MNIHVFSSLALLCCLYQHSEGKQCVRFQDSPLASCAAAGYNYTYPLPDGLSQPTVSYIKRYLSYVTRRPPNCSVAQIAETIVCMNYAPRCMDANKDPVLPCRRVCSELLKRCSGSISGFVLQWILMQCLVLPNDTAASGKCYEPKQFDQHFNATSIGPLERGCQKLINFPFCEGMGYNYTVVTVQGQQRLYKYFYRKNVTDANPTTPAPGSVLDRVMMQMKTSAKCSPSIHKLFCSEIIPPCYPDEGPAFYTVCQPVCKSIGEQCPEAVEGRLSMYYGLCERMAPGTALHGYCKHTKLPPITDWYSYLKDKPTVTPSKGLSTTVIVIISIVIPSLVIITIIAVVIVYKKRKQIEMFAYQRHD